MAKQIKLAGEAHQWEELKSSLCTKSRKVGWYLLWLDAKSVEGRKEEKGEEQKERPYGQNFSCKACSTVYRLQKFNPTACTVECWP